MKIYLEIFFYIWTVIQININYFYGLVRCAHRPNPEYPAIKYIVLGAFVGGIGFGGLLGISLVEHLLEFLQYYEVLEIDIKNSFEEPKPVISSFDDNFTEKKLLANHDDQRNLRIGIILVLFFFAWNHNILRGY